MYVCILTGENTSIYLKKKSHTFNLKATRVIGFQS